MDKAAANTKQGEEAVTKKPEDGKVTAKSKDAKELIRFMGQHYEDKVKPCEHFHEFYHAFYDIIEMFCAKHGQIQYKIPSKGELETAYRSVRPVDGKKKLNREEFMTIAEKLVSVDSFSFGKAAMEVLMVLFGAPVCALFLKRFIPGLKSFSDDVVIPVATSGAVVYLAKTSKL